MDNKWPVIAMRAGVKSGVVSAIAWELLDFASQHSERGSVTGFDPEVYAAYSGFAESEIVTVIQAMNDKGIIVNGKWANWDKRQPEREDSSAERMRALRKRKKSSFNDDVTHGDAMKRDVTHGDAPEEERDTDSEKDTETEEETRRAPFDQFRKTLETKGVVLAGESDIEAIQEIVQMGATVKDLEDGLSWKVENNRGKPVRYVSSLVGPTRTAMQKRLQSSTPKQPAGELYRDVATGEMIRA